jgi:hypothetical protein
LIEIPTLVRKFIVLLLAAQSLQLAAFSQYWQQQVNYTIDVTLNDKDHSLDAFEKLEYINNSPDTLKFIWFHIWPNAYKNDKTAYSEQDLSVGNTKFYFSDKEQRGYINRLDFKVNSVTADVEDHPLYIDVIKLILPTPLAPQQKIIITTPFHVQLPFNFSRGGHDGQSYQATQWFPKPAVYDKYDWHPMPYLDQGEFYSEFGSFDVRITVPKNYVVTATGELQNAEEKEWLLTRNNFSWEPAKEKTKSKSGTIKTTVQEFPTSSPETKTLQYKQNNIHDFAWFADKRFIVSHDTAMLASGRIIDVFTYYTPQEKEVWKNSLQFAKHAVKFYSAQVGEYPYNVVSAVQGPKGFGGGMEYPTITLISPTSSENELNETIAHEIGHNWFYGVLGTNERDHAWMDEGINTFYEHRYAHDFNKTLQSLEEVAFETFAKEKLDQPIETTSEKLNYINYELSAYYKPSEWMRWLEQEFGKGVLDKAMQEYFQKWKFKHPQPEDFKRSLEESTGKNLDKEFAYLNRRGILPNQERKGTALNFLLTPNYFKNLVNGKYQNQITIGPAIGRNNYDKFMVGLFITNYTLPLNSFKFFFAPMYSTGAKKLTGIGRMDYSFYPTSLFRKINLFLAGSAFSINKFTDTANKNYYLSFQKIVPGIRFTFKEKDPRSSLRRFIQWKTFFIGEEGLSFKRDSIVSPPSVVTRISKTKENRTLNQLMVVIENSRVLYPFRGELKLEQAENFVRTAFTGNYFFNYPKEGGVNVRLFAGKFLYTGSKTITKQFETDRYHLNMTGPNGYEDYSYSDYFIGRNEFEGLSSQQIMMRDGGFKIRTDLLASKVGKTDDWLIAANLSSTVPSGINPLSLLPVKIPLKLFFDLGTYGDVWKANAEGDRFLYEAGLQLSIFKETINIYLPILYSKVYKDYIQTVLEKKNRFSKTISFNVDISNFSLRKIDRNLIF